MIHHHEKPTRDNVFGVTFFPFASWPSKSKLSRLGEDSNFDDGWVEANLTTN